MWVPQGSILGPLLFLVYINDITYACTNSVPVLFADDTNLIFSHPNLNNLIALVNTELDRLSNWFKSNKLSLNTAKTKFILFKSQNGALWENFPHSITMDGSPIERVSEIKFLGVHIDQCLNWKHHVNLKNNVIAKNVGILHRLKNLAPSSILKTLYNTIILPHISYGAIAWGNTCKTEIKRMYILQKKAVRAANKSKYNAHTSPLFTMMNTLTLDDIYKAQCCKLFFKKHNNKLPIFLANLLSTANETHYYPTRNAMNIRPQRLKNVLSKQLLDVKVAPIWNSLPPYLKSLELSYSSFNIKLKDCYMKSYTDIWTIALFVETDCSRNITSLDPKSTYISSPSP